MFNPFDDIIDNVTDAAKKGVAYAVKKNAQAYRSYASTVTSRASQLVNNPRGFARSATASALAGSPAGVIRYGTMIAGNVGKPNARKNIRNAMAIDAAIEAASAIAGGVGSNIVRSTTRYGLEASKNQAINALTGKEVLFAAAPESRATIMADPWKAAMDPRFGLEGPPSRFLNPKDFAENPKDLPRMLREWGLNFKENKHFTEATGEGVPGTVDDLLRYSGKDSDLAHPVPSIQDGNIYTVRAPKGAAFPATYGNTKTRWIDTPSGVKGIHGQRIRESSHPIYGMNMYDELGVKPAPAPPGAPPGSRSWEFVAEQDPVYSDAIRGNWNEINRMHFLSGGRTEAFYPRTGWYPQGVTESQFYGAASAGSKVNKNAKKQNKR